MPESAKVSQARIEESFDKMINEEKEQLKLLKDNVRSKLEKAKKVLNQQDFKVQQSIEIDYN